MIGELTTYDPSQPPHIQFSWSLEEKYQVIRKWTLENFSEVNEFDGSFKNLEEPTNVDDLEYEYTEARLNSRQLVIDFFKDVISIEHLDGLVNAFESDDADYWYLPDHRYEIEVDLFDDWAVSLAELQSDIPQIRDFLEEVRTSLSENIGHNEAPDKPITREKIQELIEKLNRFESYEPGISDEDSSWFLSTGKELIQLAKDLANHSIQLSKTFSEKYVESAGATAGVWTVRVAALAYLGEKAIQLFT